MSGTYPEPDGMMTGGHSGGATSRERAVRETQEGTLSKRLAYVYELAKMSQRYGITVAYLRYHSQWHHGQASSALSNAHRQGILARLTERRDGCFVYVLPEHVDGRETQPPGHVRGGRTVEHVVVYQPALSPEGQRTLDRIERETNVRHGDPAELVLLEAADLLALLDLARAITSTPSGAS